MSPSCVMSCTSLSWSGPFSLCFVCREVSLQAVLLNCVQKCCSHYELSELITLWYLQACLENITQSQMTLMWKGHIYKTLIFVLDFAIHMSEIRKRDIYTFRKHHFYDI